MIVNYRRGIFTLKFATCRHGSEALYLKWRHVLGEESYCGALLTLRQFQRFRSYVWAVVPLGELRALAAGAFARAPVAAAAVEWAVGCGW